MAHATTAPLKRDRYHHGDLRPALVRAGIDLLEEVGLERLSLRGIAARVGVSHTAPKNHFDGLRGLLTAIATEGFRRHAAAMTEAVPPGAPRRTRLLAAASGYVAFAQSNPSLFRLMFSPALLDYGDAELGAAADASYAVLEDVSEGLDWEPIDGSDPSPRQSELMLWSAVHGYAHLTISQQLAPTEDAGVPPILAVLPALRHREDGGSA